MSPKSDAPAEPKSPGSNPSADAANAAGAKRADQHRLGKYELQKRIGAGGMGTVYLALDTELRRTVALKILPKERAANPMLVKRFKAEGQAAAHLRHENLVSVYEAGEIDGHLYIALEYVDGTDVHNLVERKGPVPVKHSIKIVRQVVRALAHAHEQNIVHRDIKPSNLLIQRDGSVKLTDFGLARSIDEETETGITRAGTTVGTVDYMAPEQARDSKAADVRSDIYSLGCTWYHMLTGGPPFPHGSVTNKLGAHAHEPPPDPRDKNPSVPEGVVAVMQRMMAKSPDDRHPSPRELLDDLDNATLTRETVSHTVLAALADGESDRGRKTTRRTAQRAAAPTSTAGSSAPSSAPPGAKQSGAAGVASPGKSIDIDLVRYGVVALIVLVALALLWWVITQFSTTIDVPNQDANPFAQQERIERYGDVAVGESNSAPGPKPQSSSIAPQPADGLRSESPVEPGASTEIAAAHVVEQPSPSEPEADSDHSIAEGDPSRAATPLPPAGHLPEWVAQASGAASSDDPAAARRELPVLTVGRGDGPPSRFAQLEQALATVPSDGAVIELAGGGPFELRPTRLAGRGTLVIRAAPGKRAIVLLTPGDGGAAAGRVAQFERLSLVLQGLDLVVLGSQFSTRETLTLVEVIDGRLAAVDCTVTVRGRADARTEAFAIRQRAARPTDPRGAVLLERVLTRGADLTALFVAAPEADVLAQDCFFAAGRAPPIVLAGGSLESDAAAGPAARDGRRLRLYSTTVVASRACLRLSHGGRQTPPATTIETSDSLLAAPAESPESTLVSLAGWPSESNGLKPAGVTWTSRSSIFPGWSSLVQYEGRSGRSIRDAAGWAQAFSTLSVPQFITTGWPAHELDFSSIEPADLDADRLSVTVRAVDGGPVGSRPARLPMPEQDAMERAAARSWRPVAPADFESGPLGAEAIEIDLDRDDLGEVISSGEWESGTRFLVSGSGEHRSQPVEVRGRSLSIEFIRATDAPLRILPDEREFAGGNRPFIVVENGRLALTGGRFDLAGTAEGEVPRWFLHVTDGEFSLRDCMVTGPAGATRGFEGCIRWDGRARAEDAHDAPGRYSQLGQIIDCCLVGHGAILDAAFRERALIVRGSLLVTPGELFRFDLRGTGSPIHSAVAISDSTLSAGKAVIDIMAVRSPQASAEPLRFFVDQTVFAATSTAPAGGAPAVTLLRDPFGAFKQGQIEWWGRSNGYSEQIAWFYVDAPTAPAERQAFEANWLEVWGASHVVRPLAGPGAVTLHAHKAGGESRPFMPGDFALDESARARTWSDTGGPIGADAKGFTQNREPARAQPTD